MILLWPFHACYNWLSLSLGEIVGSLSTGTLTCYCWISRLWHTTRSMCLKKKISWMSVLCGFLFFSPPLPLSIYPLPWHPCLALHIYFCISKCLFLFLSLSLFLSLIHMQTHAHGHLHNNMQKFLLSILSYGNRRTGGKEMRVGWGWGGPLRENLTIHLA